MSVGQKHTYVGQFFEEIGHTILGGSLSRDEVGDIFLPKSKTSVEVKGSTYQSSYGFRLSVAQIEQYEARIESSKSRNSWYMLFAYRNRSVWSSELGQRKTELSLYTTAESINQYLATAVSWCVLVDISIVRRWKEELPHQTKSIMGHLGTKTVDVKCPIIESAVTSSTMDYLSSLNLNPWEYRRVSGDVAVSVNRESGVSLVPVPLVAILPQGESRRLQNILRFRGHKVSIEKL